jgi:methionyl-tRNA synthetase
VITWELLVERLNSELANTLGNLVNRTISMSNKYFDGVVNNTGVCADVDADLKAVVTNTVQVVTQKMDKLRVADALTEIFNLFKRCNKYIDETMPWALAKNEEDKPRLETVLYNLVESIVIGASLLEPFMPETCEKILAQLHAEKRPFEELGEFGKYPSGNKVTDTPEILFARLDMKETLEKVEEIQKRQRGETETEYPQVEPKEEISIDDFDKIQIRVGEVLQCERVKKAKKLLVSQIRVGDEVRQIVSGIAQFYEPEDMVGKKVAVITNLKPVKLCGIESQGMILAASDDNGNLSVMTTDKDIIAGSEVR